ncbi:MAG: ABC transporter ATP-binding protein [Candidatus Brocadiaceae bacterium]|nr:ABC transporter ATP-binding protein [Candidatus Brocadiaceae bacterium]
MPESDVLLSVCDLKKHFPVRGGLLGRTVGHVRAVDGVSFQVRRGRTLGLVGESGCGKTTTGRTLLRLLEPTAGKVVFDGLPVHSASGRRLRALRRRMQIIFQDPYSSLDPRMTVQAIVGEPLAVHGIATGSARGRKVEELLERVGLSAAHVNHYPHEFSGGQRQRIGIARALALDPDFIVCDEPVSALDVSIQAQIINLLEDLQQERGLSYLFIAHDLAVVEHISDDVAVMYMGTILETAPRDVLYDEALHPYTRLLLSAIPRPDPDARREARPPEDPALETPEGGCPFRPRCPLATEECAAAMPALREVAPGHFVRCVRCGDAPRA